MPVLGYSSDDATAPPTALVEQPAGPLGYSSNDAIDRGIGSKLPHDPVAGAGERLFEPSVASQASGYVSAGGGTTYGDWLQTGKAGLHGAGAALATLAGKAADTPEQTAYWQKQAAGQRAEQQQDVQGMTPAGQQGRAGSFWAHPVQQAIEAAPGLAIQGIPAIIGGAMAGPPGAIAGAALAGGAYQGSSEVSDYTQQIMDAPEETLMKNPDYAALVASGMKPEDARLKFADASSKGLFAKSATIGALTSVPFAEVGGGGAAKILGDKLVTRVLAGGLEGGAAMTAQGAAQTQVSGQAGYEAGVRGPPTPEETRQGALGGLETGVQLGPAAALLHGRPGRRLDAKPGETGSEQGRTPADIRGAEAKPRATAGAPPEAPPGAPAAARQPVSPIADPTIQAATKGAPITGDPNDPLGNMDAVIAAAKASGAPPEHIADLQRRRDAVEAFLTAGKQVTPEGNQPEVATAQPERVQAPPQPQPEAQPISRPTEAPPAADTTGQVSPPRPPAPGPAAARPAIPEPDAALAAQHAALVDRSNPREAMVYEKGTPLLPLPDATFGQTRLKDGRIVQYDKQGPNALTPAKVGRLNSAGRLDEVIQDRPVIKAPAEERPAAAPGPAPEKAEAGAAATAPEQIAAQEATKTPEAVAPAQIAEVREPPAQVAEAREVTPGVTGRVLRPETEAEQAVAAQQLTAQEAVKGVVPSEEAAPAGKHWTKGELAKRENANQAANEIVQRHPPGEREQPNDIYKRAKAMVEEAQGIHVPTEVSEAGKHGPGIMLLREAKDFVAKDPNSKPALARFLDREGMIRRGELREALEARRAEGKESVALGSPEEGGAEGVRPGEHAEELSPEEEMIRREEEAEREKEEQAKEEPEEKMTERQRAAIEASKRARERLEATETVRAEGRERPKIEVKEGEHYTAAKAAASFKVEQAPKKRTFVKRQEMPVTVREGLAGTGRLGDRLSELVGDTPVQYLSHDEMTKAAGAPSHGMWDPDNGRIAINADHPRPDTLLHEAFHAAVAKGMEDPELKGLAERLRDELGSKHDPEEFLTRLNTDPALRAQMKERKISPELSRDIGVPKWRKQTLWEGALNLFRRALGMGPRDLSAIEAAAELGERAMALHEPTSQGARRFQRMNPPERDQERFVRTPSEAFKNARGITRDVAAQFTKDRMVNLSDKLMHGSAKALSGTWLNEMHGHLFEDAKGKILDAINQARNKVSSTYSKLMESDRDIINRGYMLDRIYASHMPDYAQLINLSSTHNIHADRAAPKIPKNPVDAARKNWQGNAKYDEARAIYDKLPEELRKRYSDEKRFYMDKQAQSAQAIIDKVMPLFDPPKGSTLDEVMARARKNDLTDDDWEHYENLKVAPALRKAANLLSKKDFYANSQRDGRYVVTGRYEMPAGGSDTSHSGELLPDNKREFDTEKEAHDYVVGTHMHAITREVHYWTDKATGDTKRVPADFATSDPGKETIKYQVRLERDNTQMATSKAEALRNRQAMEADGVKELSGVLDKRDEKAWSKINTADQKAIERKIDGSPNLTDAERQSLKDMSRQLMLAGQGGMGAHMIQARKVAGAKYDTGAGLHAYARAANYHMAREEHAAEIDDGMTRLDEHERANRMDTDASRRSIVANEYRDRVYGRNADTLDAKTHPLLHRMMTWAFVNFLMRPSHILLSQVHPYVYSVPMLASRHGYWKALQGQRQAMNDLGGTLHNLKEGMQAGWDVYRSGRERDIDRAVQMAHGVDPIRVMIARLKNVEEREFLNKMWDTQHLHSAFDASVFEGSGMDRANAAMKQFTDAMEANNRLSTALNAYRLEKAMHGDKAQALSYSRRVIEETHGLFSPTNAASAFKNPIVRAALQFRQQPMNLAIMMYRNIAKAATGDAEARWTLAYQLGTAAALGGMGGMPMDLPKLAGLAGQALGGPSPDDWADRTHRFLVSVAGETVANGIENGIPGMMGPFGPSLGHRTGFDAGFLFGSPNSERPDDMLSYAAKMAIGATGGMAVDWLNAVHQMEQGNYERASEGVLPGSLKDFAKAYRLATEGTMAGKQQVRPASYGEALLQALGFSSVEREQALAGHMALQKAIKAQPLTRGEQLKQAHRARQTVLGVPVTARDRALAQEYQRAYQ